MRIRRFTLGSVDLLVCVPDVLADRLRSLGGLLPRRSGRAAPAATRGGRGAAATGTNAPPVVREADDSPEVAALRRHVAAIEWYHSIDLGHGVVTPGFFDHRPHLSQYPIPDRLDGMRVLDVATFDGFWAFELERRGAKEVVALDLETFGQVDWPPARRVRMSAEELARPIGQGFRLCHEVLGSQVHRETLNVYDLSPERLGTFDFVFMGDVLLHLTNPVKALQNVCRVTTGHAVIVDVFYPALPGTLVEYGGGSGQAIWWLMGYGALERMIRDAGFGHVECASQFVLPPREGRVFWRNAAFRVIP